nr:type VI secretion system baseplate subunit TssF [Planctomycetota bacterium]
MFNQYYQDELLFLRDLGREFAKANPESAKYLGEPGADPDVERLLEGVAFLAGRIRQKLDDELPELTHALIDRFWPHYLRPLPAMAVVQFTPSAQTRDTLRLSAGTRVDSIAVQGTACRFRTAYAVELAPLRLERVELEREPARLRLGLRLKDGASLGRCGIDRLRLHLAGEATVSRALHACLCRYASRVSIASAIGGPAQALTVSPVGFAADESLLPFPGTSSTGYRVLTEYFAYPGKFMFVDLVGLAAAAPALGDANELTVTIELERLPARMPPVSLANVVLGCAPALNLFAHEADPIAVDQRQSEYRVRPSGNDPAHYEIHSLTAVQGLVRGSAGARSYRPMLHVDRGPDAGHGSYHERRRPSVLGSGADHYLSVTDRDAGGGAAETMSVSLLCTNRDLPAALALGDLRVPTADVPAGVTVRNLTLPTASVSPAVASDLHWRLLAHLNVTYSSAADLESLRAILDLYDLRDAGDRAAERSHQRRRDAILA